MAINFNVDPYYDDYETSGGGKDESYHRILFVPGRAVQARELTQLQSILQEQVNRFGKHVFKEGSIVTGSGPAFSTKVYYVKLQNTSGLDVTKFLGKGIGDKHAYDHGTALGKVVAVATAEGNDPPTLFVEYITGNTVADNSTLYTIESGTTYTATTAATSSTGLASTVSIDDAVYFIRGNFVRVDTINYPSTLVLNKYDNTPSYRVGLQIEESFVDYTEDSNLLDPALGASNFQAPGADRYKLSLYLTKKNLDATDDTNFIEIGKINSGIIETQVNNATYADLEKTLARRTYDQSGHFVVNTFVPHINNMANNTTQFYLNLGPGKAYVQGFEFETVGPQNLVLDRAREKGNTNNYALDCYYGNYIYTANNHGNFSISTQPIIDLHCVIANSSTGIATANSFTYANTKIGTARIREQAFSSASSANDIQTYIYKSFLYDTNFTPITGKSAASGNSTVIFLGVYTSNVANAYANATVAITAGTGVGQTRKISYYDPVSNKAHVATPFVTAPDNTSVYSISFDTSHIKSFVANNYTGGYTAFANVHSSSIINGLTQFTDTAYKSLAFALPNSFVANNITDTSYAIREVFTGTSSGGTITLTSAYGDFVGSGTLSSDQKQINFYVANTTSGNTSALSLTAGSRSVSVTGSTATITFPDISISFPYVAYATVNIGTPVKKTKTLRLANTISIGSTGGTAVTTNTTVYLNSGQGSGTWGAQVIINYPNKVQGNTDCLYISDIYKLSGAVERDYGYFSITLPSGSTANSSFKVLDFGNRVVDNSNLSSATDITYKYLLDDGQRSTMYDFGNLVLKPGMQGPTGNICAFINYSTVSGGMSGTKGYFNVDSYMNSSYGTNSDIQYIKIPSFTDPATGQSVMLSDVIDFRPTKTNASTANTLNYALIPESGADFTVDYSYYLGRTDKVVLRPELRFDVIRGLPSVNPQTPKAPDTCISLYDVYVPPFTTVVDDIRLNTYDNRRYTMQDIGRLEKRIENLEYYTSLNTLEKVAKTTTILDSTTGLEKFKNGIVVDAFTGHSVGDVQNPDYYCSMDFRNQYMRPAFNLYTVHYDFDLQNTTANRNGSLVTNTYTESSAITQDIVSGYENANPFILGNYVGVLEISPASDTWFDKAAGPAVNANLTGGNDAYAAWSDISKALTDPANSPFNTQWGTWQKTTTTEAVGDAFLQAQKVGTVSSVSSSSGYRPDTGTSVQYVNGGSAGIYSGTGSSEGSGGGSGYVNSGSINGGDRGTRGGF